MYPLRKYFLFVASFVFASFVNAQDYHAVNGSPYAGSLGVSANPASIVYSPYSWDITPLAVQVKQATNAFTIKNYSFLSSPKNAEITAQFGNKKRFFFANQDVRLLNTRINIGTNSAIAFGINLRNYVYATNSKSNWQDTIYSLAGFMKINSGNLPLAGKFTGSTWAEYYATYARTIVDDGMRMINAGITLKINTALAGGYSGAKNLEYVPLGSSDGNGYELTNGTLQYGYSSNFDAIDKNNSFAVNSKNFLENLHTGLSADIGAEYILFNDEDNNGDESNGYQTKIGISIMDIGSNKYLHGNGSRLASAGKPGITDSVLENKFVTVANLDDFNDTLSSVSGSINTLTGNFSVYEPTRLVINADKQISTSFFINGELTIPLSSLVSKDAWVVKDMNLLALTARWETRSFGAYLPLLLNQRKQFWIGGALRAGPVLLGIHNLNNIFSKSKAQNGGFYFAFLIRPGKGKNGGQQYERTKLTGKVKRSVECPKL